MLKLKHILAQALLYVGLIASGNLQAQQTAAYTEPERLYHDGLELYNHQKYGAAQKKFTDFVATSKPSLLTADAQFYAALCALELQNKDGEYLLLTYLDKNPGNNRKNQAFFELGKYYFAGKQHKKAIPYFEKTDFSALNAEQQDEYRYKLGYSYFTKDDFAKALVQLEPLTKKQGIYSSTAQYYVAHIHYTKKNYDTALNGFLKLQNDASFKAIVPYYISQLYYLQGKYDKVIEYSPGLLDSANTKRGPEIARIIGESYYRTNKFAEAVPFLETYKNKSGKGNRFDAYQLGYAYYKSAQYEKAVDEFKGAAGEEDSLGQNAHYHLAACYLQLNNKPLAREEFGAASRTAFDPIIEEDALFNYAKLSYELAINPYGEAIDAFELYIKKYPKSDRRDEAYGYLVSVYLNTKNYKKALESLDKIKVKDLRMKEAYQKIAFFRGVELFNDQKYGEAIDYFDKSADNSFNKSYFAQAKYWKGEAQYRMGDYKLSVSTFDEFQEAPGAANLPEFNKSHYNLGYSHYKLKDYSKSATAFRKYVSSAPSSENRMVSDALLRIGDSYFINKDYTLAADFYGQASEKIPGGSAYAMFQRGIVQGLGSDYKGKVETMQKLINSFPKSPYLDDAKFETGQAYELLDDPKQAMSYFEQVVKDHPNSELVRIAKVKTALLHYANDDDQTALKIFKEVVERYPGSDEAATSLNHIKDIAIENADITIYTDVIGKLPQGANTADLDSSTYQAAYNAFAKNDCDKATPAFKTYIDKYPAGVFILQAHYYRAECEYDKGNLVNALPDYNFIILKPNNKFSEKSLLRAGIINFKKNNYTDALANFEQLESVSEKTEYLTDARAGQMRCYYALKQYQQCVDAAGRLLATEKVTPALQTEAQVYKGRSAMELGDLPTAQTEFRSVAKSVKSALGAEAKYNLVNIAYLQKDHKAVEKLALELSSEFSSYSYWVAKGFIVWADSYYDQGNAYQAKLTLQSILDNYAGKDDVRDLAQTKLNKIIQEEKAPKIIQPDQPDEIEIDGNSNINVEPAPEN
jgi:TolA-binding protein